MLIDDFMPVYDVRERHMRLIKAPSQTVYQSLKVIDLRHSLVVTTLFKLRGLPDTALTLSGLDRMGFAPLAEQPLKEIALGLIGQFWKVGGGIIRVGPVEFSQFEASGYTKAVLNFSLEDRGQETRLKTETRVRC